MSREQAVQKVSDDPLSTSQPVVLLLLDGWGVAPESEGNAISPENSKNFLKLLSEYPAGTLNVKDASESKRYASLGASGHFSTFLNSQKIKQAYLAESEKSSAVLGSFVGPENISQVENRVISSPICDSYELEPEMSLEELSRAAIKIIREGSYRFILISVANLDAVAFSGDVQATKKALSRVDSFLGKITEEVLLKKGILVVSSAGGNAEQMFDVRTELVDRGNTLNPVPFLIIGEDYKGLSLFGADAPGGDLTLLNTIGSLEDVPVTILNLMNIERPDGFVGKNLLEQ